jgi:DNA-binding NarL/FixJ family response regulator
VGPDFHQNRIQFSDPGYLARQKVLGELGVKIESNLSVAELETLKLLQKGYTASQIGTSLYRSRRTIEHRIERIKAKLSCASRRELIEKAEVLERSSSAFSVLY